MDKVFRIGAFCFRIYSETEIPVPENLSLSDAIFTFLFLREDMRNSRPDHEV